MVDYFFPLAFIIFLLFIIVHLTVSGSHSSQSVGGRHPQAVSSYGAGMLDHLDG